MNVRSYPLRVGFYATLWLVPTVFAACGTNGAVSDGSANLGETQVRDGRIDSGVAEDAGTTIDARGNDAANDRGVATDTNIATDTTVVVDASTGDSNTGDSNTNTSNVLPSGTASVSGTCTPASGQGEVGPPGATCERLVVHCPNVDDIFVDLRTSLPTAGTPRGTVVFGSGVGGGSFLLSSASANDPPLQVAAALRQQGYTLIERGWDASSSGGWWTSTTGSGIAARACRHATLMRFLSARQPANQALCAVGHSGGAVELAYSTMFYDLDNVLDLALFTGGSLHSASDACFLGDPGERWNATCQSRWTELAPTCSPRCEASVVERTYINLAYANTNPSICGSGNAPTAVPANSVIATLDADSPIAALRSFDRTHFRFIEGQDDCLVGSAGGVELAHRLTALGVDATARSVNSRHNVISSSAGAAAIQADIVALCHR